MVLTTYAVVENEYRAIIDKMKVACEYCGKKLLPRTLVVHQQYFCGPEAELTEKLKKREKKQKIAAEKAMVTLKIKKDGQVARPAANQRSAHYSFRERRQRLWKHALKVHQQ